MRDYALFFGGLLCILLAMALDLTAQLASMLGRNWLAFGGVCHGAADYLVDRALQVGVWD